MLDVLPADGATTLTLRSGETLLRQGDTLGHVYAIRRGYLKFSRVEMGGGSGIAAILDAGQLFGAGLSGGNVAAYTISAKGRANVLRFGVAQFRQHLADNVELVGAVITMLAQRQVLVERRLQAVLHLDVRARIVVVLNDLCRNYGARCAHGHEVDVPLTQQELAELVGASRPVVSSRLNDLRREGLVEYARGTICVDDVKAMQVLAELELLST